MRLPRLKLQVRFRTLVIIVALAAVGLGTVLWMDRRASHFRRVAMDYRDMAKLDEITAALEVGRAEVAEEARADLAGPDSPVIHLARNRRYAAIEAYRRVLQRRYEYAAAHPWFPIGPDPPAPEFRD
jgi:hypothetical protein